MDEPGSPSFVTPTPGTLEPARNALGKVPRHACRRPPSASAFGRRRGGMAAGVSGSFANEIRAALRHAFLAGACIERCFYPRLYFRPRRGSLEETAGLRCNAILGDITECARSIYTPN